MPQYNNFITAVNLGYSLKMPGVISELQKFTIRIFNQGGEVMPANPTTAVVKLKNLLGIQNAVDVNLLNHAYLPEVKSIMLYKSFCH